MDKFESNFEDMDVQTGVMEGAMQSNVVTSVPEDQVRSRSSPLFPWLHFSIVFGYPLKN
jgi:hypothetical protein